MGGPWEKYQNPAPAASDGPWTKYANPTPTPAPSEVPSFLHKALGYAEDNAGPILGGMMGGALGIPAGPAGIIGGATLGGAAGRALQRNVEYATGSRDPLKDTSLGNAADIAKSGLGQGAAAGVGLQTEAVLKALAPPATKVGAAAMKIASGIPEKTGEMLLKDPAIMNRGLPPSARGAPYQAFERYTGLKGLGTIAEESDRASIPPAELETMAVGTANKVRRGEAVTPQELYSASQAENHMRQAAKYNEPGAARALESGVLGRAGKVVDAKMAEIYPEYPSLLKGNAESHAREAASNLVPRNRNGSVNILRPVMAAKEAMEGDPTALAFIPPATWGTGIRALGAATPVVKAVAPAAFSTAGQVAANAVPNPEPSSSTPSPVPKSPNLISMILKANTLNPDKSGQWGKELAGIGLPSSMISKSGKNDISRIAQILHDEGAIAEPDEGEAVKYLKSIAGKVK